ncbi:DsbA family protein, partial [Pseudoxanthomonas sp. SGD-10]
MIRKQKNQSNKVTREDRVEIAFYTDPLCCWSWALQPHLFKLLEEYEGIISLRLYLGGLIKDWKQFSDPINNISKPSQMGPLWMDAARKTGVFIDESLWVNDPPLSS